MIAVAELPQTMYDEDQPIIPKRIGFCTNWTDRIHICGRAILSDDIEAVELEPIGRRRQFCCGPCFDNLFKLKPVIDLPEKGSKPTKKLREPKARPPGSEDW